MSAKRRRNKAWRSLNLSDDYLFAKVMSDREVCKVVLEKLLEISIEKLEVPTGQKVIDLLAESKGVRLDVYVNDEKGTIYNIEMQRTQEKKKERLLEKRSRYYQGSIDLDIISKGESCEKLKKSMVIFICSFDPFGRGRHRYTFENICKEEPDLRLEDDTMKVFFNTRGTKKDVSDEVEEFLQYVENSTDEKAESCQSELVKLVHKRVKEVKESKELEVEYMTLMQREREIGEKEREKGRKEGRKEGQARGARMLQLRYMGKSYEEIAELMKANVQEVSSFLKEYETFAIV